jgi:hypothetical protein
MRITVVQLPEKAIKGSPGQAEFNAFTGGFTGIFQHRPCSACNRLINLLFTPVDIEKTASSAFN